MLTSIRLQNFRIHNDSSFEFEPGVNVIVGKNASGKTSVLEGVLMGATGKNRSISSRMMLNNQSNWFRLDLRSPEEERSVVYEPSKKNRPEYIIASNRQASLRSEQKLPVVWFDPDSLRIISGSPVRRRDYLDSVISMVNPLYSNALKSYNRALKQRNTLLKQAPKTNQDQFFVWNVRLAENAKIIVESRRQYIQIASGKINSLYHSLAVDDQEFELSYDCSLGLQNYADQYLAALSRSLQRDIALGYTSLGPHRDDMAIRTIKGRPVVESASRGETRSLLITLKLIEIDALGQHFQQEPLLLLDDVFSELDGSRRGLLTNLIGGRQSILTTTDADVASKLIKAKAHIIAI